MESQPKGALLPQFYAGRSVFITGGTGFMGKTWRDIKRKAIAQATSGKVDLELEKLVQILKIGKGDINEYMDDEEDDVSQDNLQNNDGIMHEEISKSKRTSSVNEQFPYYSTRVIVRSTSNQIKLLVDFMTTHPDFATNKLGSVQNHELWLHLKGLLAKCGPDKDLEQWKTTWRDIKRKSLNLASCSRVHPDLVKLVDILKAAKESDTVNYMEAVEDINLEDYTDGANNVSRRNISTPKSKKNNTDRETSPSSMSRIVRSSTAQRKCMRAYMKANPEFASNKDLSPAGQRRHEAQWLKLKQALAKYGPDKSVQKWKTTWRDIKRQDNMYKKEAIGSETRISTDEDKQFVVDYDLSLTSEASESNPELDMPQLVKIRPKPFPVTVSSTPCVQERDIKVLIERLLSTCPDIGLLHLLMRPKRDVEPEKRLLQLKQSQVFDVVRKNNPYQLDKLRMVAGDVSTVGLGLSQESLEQLKDVSIVFHSAATLKFDEALNVAVNQNVRSVMRLMDICDSLPKMAAFVYVSTAYSNAEKNVIEEEVYPPPAPLDQLLAITDAVPEEYLSYITHKYISPKPNTYTFTKAMAEYAVKHRGNTKYPVAIFRPTIVISSVRHPYPGWVENLNGPSGVLVASGKGLLHVFICKHNARADMLPVDIAIDTLIAVAWETANNTTGEVKVYNCSTYENPTNWYQFEVALRKNLREHPLDSTFWYPTAAITDNKYTQKALEIMFQTIPLHIAEYLVRFLGIKTRMSLITASQRLRAMNEVLMFFSLREWHFKTDNVKKLRESLSPEDSQIYNLDPHSIDWNEHYINFVKGTRKYLLQEKDEDMLEARRHLGRMRYLHYAVIALTIALLFRVFLQNNLLREFVYGLIKLLLSLLNSAYTSVTAISP